MNENEHEVWLSHAQPAPARETPVRSARRTWFLRSLVALLVILALAGSALYVVLDTAPDAAAACALTAQSKPQNYRGSSVEFQVFGPGGIGWECYALDSRNVKHHIASLGLNPAYAELPIGIDV